MSLNRFKNYYECLGRRRLVNTLVFSYLFFFLWVVIVNYIDLVALRHEGIYPEFAAYWSELISIMLIFSPIIIYAVTGLIPSLIVFVRPSNLNAKISTTLWNLSVIGVGVYGVVSKYLFHLERGSFGI
jgi:hypothetical protein